MRLCIPRSWSGGPRPALVIPIGRGSPCEWAKLINKLRRVGLESQARRLQTAVKHAASGGKMGPPGRALHRRLARDMTTSALGAPKVGAQNVLSQDGQRHGSEISGRQEWAR